MVAFLIEQVTKAPLTEGYAKFKKLISREIGDAYFYLSLLQCFSPIKCQCCPHIETSQLISR